MTQIQAACQTLRESMGCSLQDVANDINYTRQNIYHFEHGNNRNYEILLWYIANGLNIKQYINEKGCELST